MIRVIAPAYVCIEFYSYYIRIQYVALGERGYYREIATSPLIEELP